MLTAETYKVKSLIHILPVEIHAIMQRQKKMSEKRKLKWLLSFNI